MTCDHAATGQCVHPIALPLYGARPSAGTCARCAHYEGPPRGLGDVVASVTHAVGIRPCGGCQERRQTLNEILPNPFKAD